MSVPVLGGFHHVTAIASDPQRNLDFYVRVLGLRLVKQTVNFDDPGTYHFYYGDDLGRPGTLITFFPWAGVGKGRGGAGQVTATAFAVPQGALPFWVERLKRYGVTSTEGESAFAEPVLRFEDPDGLPLELVAIADASADRLEVPAEAAIAGLARFDVASLHPDQTSAVLTDLLGFTRATDAGNRTRFTGPGGAKLDLLTGPPSRAMGGSGTVHHIAFRVEDAATQLRWIESLTDAGIAVTPVMDRSYFQSIYFREPGGILYEIATDGPGFTVDEPEEDLGSTLKLPEQFERHREQIQQKLPVITVPVTGVLNESY